MTSPNQDQDSYSSLAMQTRRRRILDETRALIGEQGIDGFSLMELCRRAGVAKQTIYYAFGNKNRLIAATIRDFFEESEQAALYRSREDTLDRLVERTVAIGLRNLQIRNYVAAIIAFYHSSVTDSDLWRELHDIMVRPQTPYIFRLASERRLQPWTDPEQLVDALDGQRLSIANDWIHGRIADRAMIDRMTTSQLTYLLGAVKGAPRREIEHILREIMAIGAEAYVSGLSERPSKPDHAGAVI